MTLEKLQERIQGLHLEMLRLKQAEGSIRDAIDSLVETVETIGKNYGEEAKQAFIDEAIARLLPLLQKNKEVAVMDAVVVGAIERSNDVERVEFKVGDRVTVEQDPEFRGTVISFQRNIVLVAADDGDLVSFNFSHPGTGKLILLDPEPETPTEQENDREFEVGDRVAFKGNREQRGTVRSLDGREGQVWVDWDNGNCFYEKAVRLIFLGNVADKSMFATTTEEGSDSEPTAEQEVVNTVVDRVIEESNGLTQPELAQRLGKAPNTLSSAKKRFEGNPADFAEYTKNLDPEGIAWRWDAKESKYYRYEVPKEEPIVAIVDESFNPGDLVRRGDEFLVVIFDRGDTVECLDFFEAKRLADPCDLEVIENSNPDAEEEYIIRRAIALSKEYEVPSEPKSSTNELKPGDIVDFDDENLAAVISDGDGVELLPFVENPNPIVVPFWRVGHRPDVVPTFEQLYLIERAIALSKGEVEQTTNNLLSAGNIVEVHFDDGVVLAVVVEEHSAHPLVDCVRLDSEYDRAQLFTTDTFRVHPAKLDRELTEWEQKVVLEVIEATQANPMHDRGGEEDEAKKLEVEPV